MVISNYVFGLAIKQFERVYKDCLDRRQTHEQWILNLRYNNKASNEYLEYLQNCTKFNTELKLRKLSEHHELEREQHELERAQIEIKFRQQIFNQRSEMEEANLEESVWQEAVEEDTDNNSGIINIRNISQTVSQTLQSSIHESEKECINMNSISGQTAATDKPTMNINNSTQGISAQSGFSDVSVSSIDSAFQRLASTLHEGFNLPKPDLLTFNGTSLDYSKFIWNFETNIEGRISDNSLRLSYLIQYCRGEAKCCIEDCVLLDSDEGYKRARAILYSRYGRLHVIAIY
ncbi:unnamed protein product [Mytilus edulis]|uniref:Uncharacterized protein n=1 Tax=Mytilus edulis TaxID=6550 RepID=A0A8S3Q5D6_MYTED|nr:unnamed protein product [Mytilus edulis]